VNRRNLLAGMTGVTLSAQAPAPGQHSLYIPKAHLVEDRKLLHDFMDEFSFVELVTAGPEIRVTHIPVLIDRAAGPYGRIYGHVSRQNPQSKTFDGQHSAVIVFRGPHSYISPTWYSKPEAVPTWNFAAVHASGKLKPIAERKPLHDILSRLINKFEGPKSAYNFARLPDKYKFGLMEGIIGFEMDIDQLEGKFKLGQERSDADKAGILKNLKTGYKERSIEELTASFYKR
jgi:transcriptional regulator